MPDPRDHLDVLHQVNEGTVNNLLKDLQNFQFFGLKIINEIFFDQKTGLLSFTKGQINEI